jgi:hypothetical protein
MKCIHCKGLGFSKDYEKYEDEWYGKTKEDWQINPFNNKRKYNAAAWMYNITQDDVNALKESTSNRLHMFDNENIPTPEEVNKWALKGLGHDSLNCFIIIKHRLKKEGKSISCPECNGTGKI